MIRAVLFEGANKELWGYDISGHAEYADSGSDIICSAVSVLAINTCNSIEALTGLEVTQYEEEGHLHVEVPGIKSEVPDKERALLLLQSLRLGLKGIAKSYGSQYLQITTIRK